MTPSDGPGRGAAVRRASCRATAVVLVAVVLGSAGWGFLTPAETTALTAERARLRIDPNRATAAELELLPEIGPKLANAIRDLRAASARRPAFRGPEDLLDVRGIGPATLDALRPYLAFDDPAAAGATGGAAGDAP